MAEQQTNWTWELQKLQTQMANDAAWAIGTWHDRWKGLLDQAQVEARYAGTQSHLVPSTETMSGSERRWTDKPLEDKTADLQEMIAQLGRRVDRMIANRDSETMDAGWYVGVALSVHAAETLWDKQERFLAEQDSVSQREPEVVVDTSNPQMEEGFQALLARLDHRLEAVARETDVEVQRLQRTQGVRY